MFWVEVACIAEFVYYQPAEHCFMVIMNSMDWARDWDVVYLFRMVALIKAPVLLAQSDTINYCSFDLSHQLIPHSLP